MKLYKYLPPNDGSLCVLSDSTIKFTSPGAFNDPFDCHPFFDPASAENVLKNRKEIWSEYCRQNNFKPAQKVIEKNKANARLRNSLKSGTFHNGVIERIGIVCLSATPSCILMWSHYAANHTGFVVEFEIELEGALPTNRDSAIAHINYNLIAQEVNYRPTRPVFRAGESDLIKAAEVIFLSKASEWAYEKEHRVIDHANGSGIRDFNPKLVTGVYMGSRMSPDFELQIRNAAEAFSKRRGEKVKLYKAIESLKKFELEFRETQIIIRE